MSPPIVVWHAHAGDLVREPSNLAGWLLWLSPAERERYARFLHDHDRHMFLAGRVMARSLVGRALGCTPAAWRWREGPHGRPEIDEPGVTVHFNVAHSADLVVCAVAMDREVGVDVEDLQRRPVDRRFVTRYCAPAEAADIAAQPEDTWHDRFLTYWTLKEAYLKARGLGVSVPLADVCFTPSPDGSARVSFLGRLADSDPNWLFHLMQPTDRHVLAVAAPTADGLRPAIEFARFDWRAIS